MLKESKLSIAVRGSKTGSRAIYETFTALRSSLFPGKLCRALFVNWVFLRVDAGEAIELLRFVHSVATVEGVSHLLSGVNWSPVLQR